jgi:hypothetical protein
MAEVESSGGAGRGAVKAGHDVSSRTPSISANAIRSAVASPTGSEF